MNQCTCNPLQQPQSCGFCQQYQHQQQLTPAQLQQYHQKWQQQQQPVQSDHDYDLFKQYAHLDDGELITAFYNNLQTMKTRYDDEMELMKTQYELMTELRINTFFEWCAKYRKSITKERVDNLKAFI